MFSCKTWLCFWPGGSFPFELNFCTSRPFSSFVTVNVQVFCDAEAASELFLVSLQSSLPSSVSHFCWRGKRRLGSLRELLLRRPPHCQHHWRQVRLQCWFFIASTVFCFVFFSVNKRANTLTSITCSGMVCVSWCLFWAIKFINPNMFQQEINKCTVGNPLFFNVFRPWVVSDFSLDKPTCRAVRGSSHFRLPVCKWRRAAEKLQCLPELVLKYHRES